MKRPSRHWLDCWRYGAWPWIALGMVWWYGCGGGESATAPATETISMEASEWSFRYSPGMPPSPTPALGGGWQFDFPQQDGAHYLTTPMTTSLLGKTITVTSQVIGDPVYTWPADHCGQRVEARIIIQRQGDDMQKASGRWWADVPVTLQPGAATVSVPVMQGRWTNVDGKMDGFDDAMMHPGFVGLTFGGGCFFGHGVWLQSGAARMIVREFTIQGAT